MFSGGFGGFWGGAHLGPVWGGLLGYSAGSQNFGFESACRVDII